MNEAFLANFGAHWDPMRVDYAMNQLEEWYRGDADGTYPATGRSIIAVIRKTLESPTTYTKEGWLTIGLYGSQPGLGDSYNNSGSPYICTNIFLPLGLPETDDFWTKPAEKWSAQKIWSGEDFPNDHSVH